LQPSNFGTGFVGFKLAFVEAVESALALGDVTAAERLTQQVERLPAGANTPYLRAHVGRFQARLDAAQGRPAAAEAGFKSAVGWFREIEVPFWLGVTLLEYGEHLTEQGGPDEARPLLDEAGVIFRGLDASPWLERAGALESLPTESI
jgi:hypothetical protein